MKLLTGNDELFANWAAARIPDLDGDGFGACKTVAVATGDQPGDMVLAVVVFHSFAPRQKTCQVSIAATSPRWCTRGNIRAILAVPFEEWGCRKVWSVMASTNKRALKLNAGLGFKVEGTLRHHFGRKVHAIVTGLMASEYAAKWGAKAPTKRSIPVRHDGEERGESARAA